MLIIQKTQNLHRPYRGRRGHTKNTEDTQRMQRTHQKHRGHTKNAEDTQRMQRTKDAEYVVQTNLVYYIVKCIILAHIRGAQHVGVILMPSQYCAYLGGSQYNISHPEGGSPSPCNLSSYLALLTLSYCHTGYHTVMTPLDPPPYDAHCVIHNRKIKMIITLLTWLILPSLISIVKFTGSPMKREEK